MTTVIADREQTQDTNTQVANTQVAMQKASLNVWQQKYRLADKAGIPIDTDIDATFRRVAKALAAVEAGKATQEKWEQRFYEAMKNGALPAGRIISNAGAEIYNPSSSTINCTVSATLPDSMVGIMGKALDASLTLKAGCGIGYEFSTLRPKGAYVSGVGATTSGPLSFMDIYDKMCFTVSSAGGRRGAQMATFDIHHPDVMDFIRAKREDGRLRQFNLSLLITDDFIQAVKANDSWVLSFPITKNELSTQGIALDDPDSIVWRHFPTTEEDYIINKQGLHACRVYKTVPAKTLWNMIMSSTFDYAEPGCILIDRVNQMNNNWFCEDIRATNPCGEVPLPPHGSCLLGSVLLTSFIEHPFTPEAHFNWDKYREVVSVFTRMLDNVVEINGLPLEGQQNEIKRKRRHGMGYLGLGSAMTMLGMTYGEEAAVVFTERVTREMAIEGWKTGLELAKEKGPAPIMDEQFNVTSAMLFQRPEMARDGWREGETITGKVLHAKYSRYMQRIAEVEPELVKALAEVGCRFTHHTAIAPTGTLALSIGNNVSNGIEPSFAHQYSRNIIQEGRKAKESVSVYSYELLAYRHLINPNASPNAETPENQLPAYFTTSDSIPVKAHVDIQAAAQTWVDSSISKTINVPTDIDYNDFKDIYLYAHEKGLKGCTTFRFNPEAFQGVLVKEEDLATTSYCFTTADGSTLEVKGNELVEYEGETYTAANLYDAHKEGLWGRF